jgi:hypothetical protein
VTLVSLVSAELNRPAGHAEPEAVDDGALGPEFAGRRAEGDEQRREVLGARVGEAAGRVADALGEVSRRAAAK